MCFALTRALSRRPRSCELRWPRPSWAGIGVVATMLTAAICQLPFDSRTCGSITALGIGLLFVPRVIGDTVGVEWMSWLSPLGWSTCLAAWSTPQWWVLVLHLVVSSALGAWAIRASRRRVTSRPAAGPAGHRDGMALAVWTVATGGLALLFGTIVPDVTALLGSPNAREIIRRPGGDVPLREALISAELSIAAAMVAAFGVGVLVRASGEERPGRSRVGPVAVALAGSTWLLVVTGSMFAVGQWIIGAPVTGTYAVSLNHAPAVWAIVAMTAVVRSLRPAWTAIGWALVALFTLGHLGRMVGLLDVMVDVSPLARGPLMPSDGFNGRTTVALAAGACLLLAVAAYDYLRRDR